MEKSNDSQVGGFLCFFPVFFWFFLMIIRMDYLYILLFASQRIIDSNWIISQLSLVT